MIFFNCLSVIKFTNHQIFKKLADIKHLSTKHKNGKKEIDFKQKDNERADCSINNVVICYSHKFVDKKRYAAISERRDFTFETVLSSEYKLEILRKAKNEGYFIKCIFVLTVDPYINVARVAARVAQGGHNVEKEKVVSRYKKSLANIKELLSLCDILHVYNNTFEPVRIIRKHKDDISIFANDLWSEEQILKLIQ